MHVMGRLFCYIQKEYGELEHLLSLFLQYVVNFLRLSTEAGKGSLTIPRLSHRDLPPLLLLGRRCLVLFRQKSGKSKLPDLNLEKRLWHLRTRIKIANVFGGSVAIIPLQTSKSIQYQICSFGIWLAILPKIAKNSITFNYLEVNITYWSPYYIFIHNFNFNVTVDI